MDSDVTLALAGLCLGVAITGAALSVAGDGGVRDRVSLGLVFGAFGAITALPLVWAFAGGLYLFYLPVILVLLLILPPAIYHYVLSKTAGQGVASVPWRDLVLPVAGAVVCLGFWVLPAQAKATLFLEGELPPGVLPAALALATFGLILLWLAASFAYVVAVVRCLRRYRVHIRDHYSNLDRRDLRWVDWVMGMLLVLWGAAAVSLGADNLGPGPVIPAEVLFGLAACYLVSLTVFANRAPPPAEPPPPDPSPDLPPDLSAEEKYTRSALSSDHAAKLAQRIEGAMRRDAVYLDPNLSLQKLSRHVGAPPNLVSQTLNEAIGSSFFDYVALWRIEASKPMILAGEASVLAVALEVGFNSRSTFYKAFKRETGATPKAFREAQAG